MKPTILVASAATVAALAVAALMLCSTKPTRSAPHDETHSDGTPEIVQAVRLDNGVQNERRECLGAKPAYTYHANTGAELRFALHGKTKLDLRAQNGELSAGPALDLDGQLVFAIRSKENSQVVAEVRCADLVITTRNAAAVRLTKDLSAGALVRMTESGQVLGYRFAEGIDPESRNWLRNLVDVARVGFAEERDGAWSVEEFDSTGKALVTAQWVGAETANCRPFTKTKVRYLDQAARQLRPELDTRAGGTFDAALGWVRTIQSTEHAHLLISDVGITVESHAEFALELVAEGTASPSTVTFSERESLAIGSEDAREAQQNQQREEWRAQLQNVHTQELIARLLELAKGDLASPELLAARERLVWALRLWPERLTDVMNSVRSGSLEDTGLMVLLAAVGSVQNDQAQNALAECTKPDLDERTRVYSLRSLFQVVTPNAQALAAVLTASRDASSEITANTALLLVGAFAARDGKNVDALLGLATEAAANHRLENWLEAVGNCGASKAFSAVEPHLGADDPRLRAAALNALRDMPGESCLAALELRAAEEKIPEIRRLATTLLTSRPEPKSLSFAEQLLQVENDEELHMAALRGFSARTSEAGVRSLLERTVASNHSQKLREYAALLLTQG